MKRPRSKPNWFANSIIDHRPGAYVHDPFGDDIDSGFITIIISTDKTVDVSLRVHSSSTFADVSTKYRHKAAIHASRKFTFILDDKSLVSSECLSTLGENGIIGGQTLIVVMSSSSENVEADDIEMEEDKTNNTVKSIPTKRSTSINIPTLKGSRVSASHALHHKHLYTKSKYSSNQDSVWVSSSRASEIIMD
jgi:hypothetical protein